MIGFFLIPSPPMALLINSGKFGGFLQVVANDLRSMNSQETMSKKFSPQVRTFEKP